MEPSTTSTTWGDPVGVALGVTLVTGGVEGSPVGSFLGASFGGSRGAITGAWITSPLLVYPGLNRRVSVYVLVKVQEGW